MVANRMRVVIRLSLSAIAAATAAAGLIVFHYGDPGALPPVPAPPADAQTTKAVAVRLSSARGKPTPRRRVYSVEVIRGDVKPPGGYAAVAEEIAARLGDTRLRR